jgi:hypothetical protein
METLNLEVVTLDKSGEQAVEYQIRELNEIQLALIGGGIGEVIVG